MKYRIIRARLIGAWRVLRGEYVAGPRVQVVSTWPISSTPVTSTNSAIFFNHIQ